MYKDRYTHALRYKLRQTHRNIDRQMNIDSNTDRQRYKHNDNFSHKEKYREGHIYAQTDIERDIQSNSDRYTYKLKQIEKKTRHYRQRSTHAFRYTATPTHRLIIRHKRQTDYRRHIYS